MHNTNSKNNGEYFEETVVELGNFLKQFQNYKLLFEQVQLGI
jgi:hypothetical protein